MKGIDILMYVMFLLLGISLSGLYFSYYEVDFKPNISIEYQKYSDPFFRAISQNSNARPYEVNVYDCTEFSKNLAHDLNELNWSAEDVYVKVNCSSGLFEMSSCLNSSGGHRIVKVDDVWIEATSGHVIPPWEYKDYGIN